LLRRYEYRNLAGDLASVFDDLCALRSAALAEA
jgi:hypothetical protein